MDTSSRAPSGLPGAPSSSPFGVVVQPSVVLVVPATSMAYAHTRAPGPMPPTDQPEVGPAKGSAPWTSGRPSPVLTTARKVPPTYTCTSTGPPGRSGSAAQPKTEYVLADA